METAVQKLEILFSQAERELSVLATKVDTQYNLLEQQQQQQDSDSTSGHNRQLNFSSNGVTKIVGNVNQLRSELLKVAEDVATLQQQQQQVMQSVQGELNSLAEHLSVLTTAIGSDAELPEVDELVEAAGEHGRSQENSLTDDLAVMSLAADSHHPDSDHNQVNCSNRDEQYE